MKMKKIAIAIAIATAATTPVMAKFGNVTAKIVSLDTKATALVTGITAEVPIFTTVAADFTTAVAPDRLEITLTNGGKFKSAPSATPTLTASWNLNAAGNNAESVGLLTESDTKAIWSVAAGGDKMASGNDITFTAPVIDMSAATGDVDMIMTTSIGGIEIGSATVSESSATGEPLATRLDTFKDSKIVNKSATADVSTVFVNFATATGVTLTEATAALILNNEPTDLPSTSAASFLVEIAGSFTGIESLKASSSAVNISSVTASNSAGSTTAVASTNIGDAGEFYIDTATDKAYAVVVVGEGASTAVKNDIEPVFELDGTIAQSSRVFEAKADLIADANYESRLDVIAVSPVVTIDRNGSSFSVNSAGNLNKIKITDMSGGLSASTGNISVLAYDASGTEVVGSITIPQLTSNSTAVIQMSDLITAFAGAVRFDFTIESTEVTVSNTKKSADGITSTTYRNSTSSGSL